MNRNEESAWDEVRKAKGAPGSNVHVSEVRKKPYDSFSPPGQRESNKGSSTFDFGSANYEPGVVVKKA